MSAKAKIVPLERIDGLIHVVRGQKVMLDSDLAALYGVATKVLNQAVRRNLDRFPEDFAFQLTAAEVEQILKSQIVTSSDGRPPLIAADLADSGVNLAISNSNLRSQFVTSSSEHGGRRSLPLAFTEQGVAMLSSVLRSPRAVQVNVEIMRAFVRLRHLLNSNAGLERKLSTLEKKYDRKFRIVFDAIRELMEQSPPLKPAHGREIGFHTLPALPKPKPSFKTRRASSRTNRKW